MLPSPDHRSQNNPIITAYQWHAGSFVVSWLYLGKKTTWLGLEDHCGSD